MLFSLFSSLSHKYFTLFAAPPACQKGSFFGLQPWYQYLQLDSKCQVQNFTVLGSHSSFLLIGLVIVDDLIRIAGLIAVFFVIYGGIQYITSQGQPDKTAKAQSTIINALIGLVISIVAVPLVSYLGNQLAT